jgi:hypothetical protein
MKKPLTRTTTPWLAVLLTALLLALLGWLFVGCAVQVPTTKIRLGSYTGEFPKQFRAEAMVIDITSNGLHFAATNIVAENEPNVIAAQGAADAARIGAMMDGAGRITSNAIGAALKLK